MDVTTIGDLAKQREGLEISDQWKVGRIGIEESCGGVALTFDVEPLSQIGSFAARRWLIRTYSLYEASRVLTEPTTLRDRLGAMLQKADS